MKANFPFPLNFLLTSLLFLLLVFVSLCCWILLDYLDYSAGGAAAAADVLSFRGRKNLRAAAVTLRHSQLFTKLSNKRWEGEEEIVCQEAAERRD